MKFKILCLLVLSINALLLSGCSQKSAPAKEDLAADIFKHELSNELVKIRITDDALLADQAKTEAMHAYKVLPRLLEEIDSHLRTFPNTTAEIEIYGFRLRSGSSGIFSFAGPDFLSGDVTVKEKNKQIAFFSTDIRSSKSGKHHPPTRRVIALIKKFGKDVNREINLANGTLPMPTINFGDIIFPGAPAPGRAPAAVPVPVPVPVPAPRFPW